MSKASPVVRDGSTVDPNCSAGDGGVIACVPPIITCIQAFPNQAFKDNRQITGFKCSENSRTLVEGGNRNFDIATILVSEN